MPGFEILKMNLLSPMVLSFLLGIFTKLVRSELRLPKDLYLSLSIYLLFAIGLKGGVELSESTFQLIALPVLATLALGCFTPLSAYFFLRKIGRFGSLDAAAMAAHYGSVSAVTFIAATQFVSHMGSSAEGFMPTLLALLESPGIHIALAMGILKRAKENPNQSSNKKNSVLHEVLTARSMILLIGGLAVGYLIGAERYEPVQPFFETGFKGALCLFLLEMGIIAGAQFSDLAKVGYALILLGILLPLFHGTIGVLLGSLSGLSVGGSTVLGAMAASASYIAAPSAVRMALPEANPAYYLTASLAITFPFNMLVGIPFYYQLAVWI